MEGPGSKFDFVIDSSLDEDYVWTTSMRPLLSGLAPNAVDIWQFCITEMVNNAIDHSGGTNLTISIEMLPNRYEVEVIDNGIGIFRKIQAELSLADERQAILELAKGKLTTDPQLHSGQGIFFTSRMLDSFTISSGGVFSLIRQNTPRIG